MKVAGEGCEGDRRGEAHHERAQRLAERPRNQTAIYGKQWQSDGNQMAIRWRTTSERSALMSGGAIRRQSMAINDNQMAHHERAQRLAERPRHVGGTQRAHADL